MSKEVKNLLYAGLALVALSGISAIKSNYHASADTNRSVVSVQDDNDNQQLTINQTRQRYQNLVNSDRNYGEYKITPNIQNGTIGSLNDNYKEQMLNWINFYRSLYHMQPLTDNSDYDNQAQYGADDLAVANEGLYHGFESIKQPVRIGNYDWQKGSQATSNSNILEGTNDPSTIITNYINDNTNIDGYNTGHRDWLLDQGLRQIGIGQDGNYNDLLVINGSDQNNDQNDGYGQPITFPNAGAFPLENAQEGMWGLYLPDYYGNKYSGLAHSRINVSVHDDTANQNVPVSHVNLSYGYGYYTAINYVVSDITNHVYTVNITGIPNVKDFSYRTALYSLTNNENPVTPEQNDNQQAANSFLNLVSLLTKIGIL